MEVWSDTPGVEIPGVWYPGPLAEKLAGQDFSPGVEDISAVFNSEVDGPVCFGDRSWYYGLDNQHGDDFDLVTVLLHEIGHGLGVASYLNIRNGRLFDGRPDIYTAHIRDNESGKLWTEMTDAERQASVVNVNHVVWDGRNVTAAVPGILAPGAPSLRVHAPDGIGPFRIGPAPFGPALTSPGVSGELVRALVLGSRRRAGRPRRLHRVGHPRQRGVAHYGEALEEDGTITGVQKGAIQSCAGGASIP